MFLQRELTSLAEADRKIALDRYRILRPHLEDGRALLGYDNRPSQISKLDGHGSVPALPYEPAKTT